MNREKANLSLD